MAPCLVGMEACVGAHHLGRMPRDRQHVAWPGSQRLIYVGAALSATVILILGFANLVPRDPVRRGSRPRLFH
jgi:hypothetical protein